MVKLQRFDLLLVKGDSFISRAIKSVTSSPYSHIAIALDEWHIAETDWRRPLIIRHLEYRPTEYDVYRYSDGFSIDQFTAMNNFIHEHLNTEYDFMESLTNGIHIFTGLPIWDSPNRMNCTEMTGQLYAAGGIDLSDLPLKAATPQSISLSGLLRKIA